MSDPASVGVKNLSSVFESQGRENLRLKTTCPVLAVCKLVFYGLLRYRSWAAFSRYCRFSERRAVFSVKFHHSPASRCDSPSYSSFDFYSILTQKMKEKNINDRA